jgi:hypothetical protein
MKLQINEWPHLPVWVENSLLLPRCCPISGNPQPGSTIRLRYRARRCFLEVYSLRQFIMEFVGGHADGTRNMETMLQKVAAAAAHALAVPVVLRADLYLAPRQRMRLVIRAQPDDFLSGNAPAALAGDPGRSAAVPVSPPLERPAAPAARRRRLGAG